MIRRLSGATMAQTVNLDALIPREDFLASSTGGQYAGLSGKGDVGRTDLMRGEAFYLTLRKPDFQRETAAWSPEAVRDFIKAFIEGDLIPTVICWSSPARLTFVIDGAHRLSAIMAWLQNDYGDGEESIKFYNNAIPGEQRRIAEKTRALVDKTIGAWKDYRGEMQHPGSNSSLTQKVLALGNSKVLLQWVPGQDASKAEKAFLTINRSAVVIDPTELKILNARFKPEAITARAIIRNATGYKYWGSFSVDAQEKIEKTASEIYRSMYVPPLNPAERTNELPIAGHGYGTQTLPLIFDFVNIANGFAVIDPSKVRDIKPTTMTAADETQTLDAITKAKKLADRITGKGLSSLGLLPAVYFYAQNSRHQPTAVLAMAAMIMDLETHDRFIDFTRIRAQFEDFLVENKPFINQFTSRYGSMSKGYRQQRDYFLYLLNSFTEGKRSEEILTNMKTHEIYKFLVKEESPKTKKVKEFSDELKNWAFLTTVLQTAKTCDLCNARLDNKSMQLGHIKDRSAGGIGSGDNSAWEHPFCNSTYKPWLQKHNLLHETIGE
jgi:hypothetical protein